MNPRLFNCFVRYVKFQRVFRTDGGGGKRRGARENETGVRLFRAMSLQLLHSFLPSPAFLRFSSNFLKLFLFFFPPRLPARSMQIMNISREFSIFPSAGRITIFSRRRRRRRRRKRKRRRRRRKRIRRGRRRKITRRRRRRRRRGRRKRRKRRWRRWRRRRRRRRKRKRRRRRSFFI